MSGEQREPALREIFSRMADHLDPAKAEGQDAVVHFHDPRPPRRRPGRVRGDRARRQVHRLREPVRAAAGDPEGSAGCFLKLITNQKSGPELFMAGQLKIDGDLMFAAQIASLFKIPTA